MTALINQAVAQAVAAHRAGALSGDVAIIVIGLLVLLLVERVVIDAYGSHHATRLAAWERAVDVFAAPLLVAFGLLVLLHLASLLGLI